MSSPSGPSPGRAGEGGLAPPVRVGPRASKSPRGTSCVCWVTILGVPSKGFQTIRQRSAQGPQQLALGWGRLLSAGGDTASAFREPQCDRGTVAWGAPRPKGKTVPAGPGRRPESTATLLSGYKISLRAPHSALREVGCTATGKRCDHGGREGGSWEQHLLRRCRLEVTSPRPSECPRGTPSRRDPCLRLLAA